MRYEVVLGSDILVKAVRGLTEFFGKMCRCTFVVFPETFFRSIGKTYIGTMLLALEKWHDYICITKISGAMLMKWSRCTALHALSKLVLQPVYPVSPEKISKIRHLFYFFSQSRISGHLSPVVSKKHETDKNTCCLLEKYFVANTIWGIFSTDRIKRSWAFLHLHYITACTLK